MARHPDEVVQVVRPGSFDPVRHYYPRVLNAQIHPLVRYFLGLSRERIVSRYCHLNPRVDAKALTAIFDYQPRHMRWAGCDLMHVTTESGDREMVVIETNSCPSGQKSMPLYEEFAEQGGYRPLIERSFATMLAGRRLPTGGLAVLYDKNPMEASGYAAVMADVFDEPVYYVPFYDEEADPDVRFDNGVLHIRDPEGTWQPIRAAMRYVTQRPWNRLPLHTKTAILNPVVCCLAGGRNKMVAAKAYDLYNAELMNTGLEIHTPETIRDVSFHEIPLWVRRFGGHAVVKVPYSNAGQGVYTITSEQELEDFKKAPRGQYDKYIVQSLIGNYQWSSRGSRGRLYHVGTMPNKSGRIYVADLRVMVSGGTDGFRPIAIYGRRSRIPLVDQLEPGMDSWSMLGTNLSVKRPDGSWDTESTRLMLMDRKDFNSLGIGLDDLIEATVQTVLATVAVDRMAQTLFNKKGRFRMRLFRSLDDDDALLREIEL